MQLSCHSVAIVLKLVLTKQVRINIYKANDTKNTVQIIQNTVNTSIHITKTLTHHKIQSHTNITKQVKTNTVQVKQSQYNQVPQYKFTPMYMALLPPRTSP